MERLKAGGPQLGLVGGLRLRRRDPWAKRVGSKIGNGVRRRILNDQATDTGCGLKALPRQVFLRLPYFDHMHRFLPALVRREGLETAFLEVSHRSRASGRSKYTNLARLKASAGDLLGVVWLLGRARLVYLDRPDARDRWLTSKKAVSSPSRRTRAGRNRCM